MISLVYMCYQFRTHYMNMFFDSEVWNKVPFQIRSLPTVDSFLQSFKHNLLKFTMCIRLFSSGLSIIPYMNSSYYCLLFVLSCSFKHTCISECLCDLCYVCSICLTCTFICFDLKDMYSTLTLCTKY